jgi:hypothetical protein
MDIQFSHYVFGAMSIIIMIFFVQAEKYPDQGREMSEGNLEDKELTHLEV